MGEPEEEAEWDPVALAVSVGALDTVARPVVELEPVPVVAPDGVEEAEGEPEKDALEVPVGEPEEEAEWDPVALAVSVDTLDAVARPVVELEPVPVLAPDGVEKADGEPEKDALDVSVGDAEAEAV